MEHWSPNPFASNAGSPLPLLPGEAARRPPQILHQPFNTYFECLRLAAQILSGQSPSAKEANIRFDHHYTLVAPVQKSTTTKIGNGVLRNCPLRACLRVAPVLQRALGSQPACRVSVKIFSESSIRRRTLQVSPDWNACLNILIRPSPSPAQIHRQPTPHLACTANCHIVKHMAAGC